MIRQPIVVLVGHVDHGKSSILERIKGISIVKGEAGGITQCIKSYNVPLPAIQKVCGNLLQSLQKNLTIPGLLFLDSPGHAAFNNMRKRGGNLADIAILVVDVNEGLKEQTLESIEILKQYKTPFVVALNKVDLISGWRSSKTSLLQNIKGQADNVQQELDNLLYTFVGKLSEMDVNSERYDRVSDYTQQVAIIPMSAKTGEGLPELLMVLMGLAQRYLEKSLQVEVSGPGKGIVLEVKEESGMGVALDLILYDGTLKKGDTIVVGGLNEPIVTKVRALFKSEKNKLIPTEETHAACGVKVSAPDLSDVVGGMPLRVVHGDVKEVVEDVKREVQEVLISSDKEGVVVKADTLGSLEALVGLLKKKDIKIKKASIGEITKKDIAEARSEMDEINKVILGFNIKSAACNDVKIITHDVIYKIIEDFEKWKEEELKRQEMKKLEGISKPFMLKILRGCVFRQSNPAVVGVQVMCGKLKADSALMKKDGSKAGVIKSIQLDGKSINEAEEGKEVAISIPGVMVGRQIKEGDILLSDIPEGDFRKLKELKKYLKGDEIELLKDIAVIKRKTNMTWGA